MNNVRIYCALIWNVIVLWLANLILKATKPTKLTGYTYYEIIVVMKTISAKIKI
jgi:hypothetical protein